MSSTAFKIFRANITMVFVAIAAAGAGVYWSIKVDVEKNMAK